MKYLLLVLLSAFLVQNPDIDTDKNRWQPYYTDVAPNAVADNWVLPFEAANRKNMSSIKIISIFGDHRDSFVKGHIHTAIDINPAKPKTKLISVFPMANGVICSIHLGENQLAQP